MPAQGRAQDPSNLSRHKDSKNIKSIFKNSVGNKEQLNRPDLHEFSAATAPVFLPGDAAHILNSGYIPWITPTLVFIFIYECINTQKSVEGGEQCLRKWAASTAGSCSGLGDSQFKALTAKRLFWVKSCNPQSHTAVLQHLPPQLAAGGTHSKERNQNFKPFLFDQYHP